MIHRKAPILAISEGIRVHGGYSSLKTAKDVGADEWLQKPLSMDEVAIWIMDKEIALKTTTP